ncbi:YueI family protein [Limosilactobacillus difficilis]|uniref:YueI family protein n=1 Tax=Limosilactobacillus difficilis TaxID=2991838 RepID=UPI0024B91A3F|nr:YueI family protein [Limosilactobacillus difficilis]
MTEENNVQDRLKQGIYGQRKINPDEQRHYLGTFRERVYVTISCQEIKERSWINQLQQEFQAHPQATLFINNNLNHDLVHPYMLAASKANVHFTLKSDPEFRTDPDKLAIVYAAADAVYQSPVDISQRYPDSAAPEPKTAAKKPHKHGFFHLFKH